MGSDRRDFGCQDIPRHRQVARDLYSRSAKRSLSLEWGLGNLGGDPRRDCQPISLLASQVEEENRHFDLDGHRTFWGTARAGDRPMGKFFQQRTHGKKRRTAFLLRKLSRSNPICFVGLAFQKEGPAGGDRRCVSAWLRTDQTKSGATASGKYYLESGRYSSRKPSLSPGGNLRNFSYLAKTILTTSSMFSTKWNFKSFWTFLGTSIRLFSLSLGRMTSLMPAR